KEPRLGPTSGSPRSRPRPRSFQTPALLHRTRPAPCGGAPGKRSSRGGPRPRPVHPAPPRGVPPPQTRLLRPPAVGAARPPWAGAGGHGPVQLRRPQPRFPAPVDQGAVIRVGHAGSPLTAPLRTPPLPSRAPQSSLPKFQHLVCQSRDDPARLSSVRHKLEIT